MEDEYGLKTLSIGRMDERELKSKRSSCRPSLHRTITLKRGVEADQVRVGLR